LPRTKSIAGILARPKANSEAAPEQKKHDAAAVKYWEIIADNLSEAGWSWGCGSAIDSTGRTIFVADAHRDDGKRFVVHADEKLTAFVELESAIRVSEMPYMRIRQCLTRQHSHVFRITAHAKRI
jgi:hypothetical protein